MPRSPRSSFVRSIVPPLLVAWVLAPGVAPAQVPELAEPDPADGMLAGDPVDPATGRAAVILPGVPWIRPGPDGVLGTADDLIDPSIRGDVDLVVRTGSVDLAHGLPAPDPFRGPVARGVAEPFGRGAAIDFTVIPSDGRERSSKHVGGPVVPPYWEGLPVLVVAFGDLDGDGFVGVTHLDGDSDDAAQEAAELDPIGMRYAIGHGDRATGRMHVFAGGPRATPLRIALAAVAFAGPFDPEFFEGLVPNGPVVATRLPFLPNLDPAETLRLGVFGLLPAAEDGRIAFEFDVAAVPDPGIERWGEAFTLRLDGSDPSIGVAEVESGAFAGFGLAAVPQRIVRSTERRLRPGQAMGKKGVAVETPRCLLVPDDGAGETTSVQVVPLDLLGNVATIEAPVEVELQTGGTVRIVHPDLDGDPTRERLVVSKTGSVDLELDDGGGRFDDADQDHLVLSAGGRTSRIDLSLADPDVDDDGVVGERDLHVIEACAGLRHVDEAFRPRLDLDGDGRIDAADVELARAYTGASAVPDGEGPPRRRFKERGWKQPKLKKPNGVRRLRQLEERDKERAKKKARKRLKGDPDWKRLRKDYCSSN